MQNARGLKSSCISVIISISIMILITGKTDDLQLVLAILMAFNGIGVPLKDPLFNLLFYYNTNHCKFANRPAALCDAGLCCVLRARRILIFSKSRIGTHGSNSKITIFPESDFTPPCPALIRKRNAGLRSEPLTLPLLTFLLCSSIFV